MKHIIANWDSLSDEDKKRAEELYNASKDKLDNLKEQKTPSVDFFEKHGWVKIQSFISPEMCRLLYRHVLMNAERLSIIEQYDDSYNPIKDKTLFNDVYGFFDEKFNGDYSKYGDPIFDALLDEKTENVGNLIGKKLIPNYTYHRLYTQGTELIRHSDRPSCEFSITLCLGYDTTNIDKIKYPNYNWPMYVQKDNEKPVAVHLNPGDMLIYRGCDLKHWREPFKGLNHAQLFMHYNEKDGKFNIKNDLRPYLGMSAYFKDNIKMSELNKIHDNSLKKIID